HPDQKLAPVRMRRYWESYRKSSNLQPATLDARRREIGKYLELTGILHRAGVQLLAGPDAPEPFATPGFSLHQELELLVESGPSPGGGVEAATLNNARILRQEEKLGRIEPGFLADLVLLRADPLADIGHSRQIELVVRGGQVVRP